MALSAKQERFCAEYIVDYNGTRAAIRAGYSENSAGQQASRMLKNDEVSARVRELQKIYNEEHCFGEKDRILAEAWEFLEMAKAAKPVLEWDSDKHEYVETGEYQIDSKAIGKALELIIKTAGVGIETHEHKFGSGGIDINVSVMGDE